MHRYPTECPVIEGVDEVARNLTLEFNVCYLVDAMLCGALQQVKEDPKKFFLGLAQLGLEVNSEECELTILDHKSSVDIQHT